MTKAVGMAPSLWKESLEQHGLYHLRSAFWNLVPSALVEQAVLRQEGEIASAGALVVNTGKFTGRSPSDKYLSQTTCLEGQPIWWGKVNQPLSPQQFNQLHMKMRAYLQGQDVFIQDMAVGAHPDYQVPIRVISEKAWASLFARNLFRRLRPEQIAKHKPEYTVLHCPDFQAVPDEDGTHSGTIIESILSANWC